MLASHSPFKMKPPHCARRRSPEEAISRNEKKNPISLLFTNATTPQSDNTVVKVLQESQIDVERDVEFISYLHQTEDLVAKQLKEDSKSTPPKAINPKELSEKDCIIICRSSVKRWSRSKLCEEEMWVYPRNIELLQKSIEEDGYGAPKLNADTGKLEDEVWTPLNFQIIVILMIS